MAEQAQLWPKIDEYGRTLLNTTKNMQTYQNNTVWRNTPEDDRARPKRKYGRTRANITDYAPLCPDAPEYAHTLSNTPEHFNTAKHTRIQPNTRTRPQHFTNAEGNHVPRPGKFGFSLRRKVLSRLLKEPVRKVGETHSSKLL